MGLINKQKFNGKTKPSLEKDIFSNLIRRSIELSDKKLDEKNLNRNSSPYGLYIFPSPTGVGKSYSARKVVIENISKLKKANKEILPCRYIFTATDINNLPKASEFEDLNSEVLRIKSIEESEVVLLSTSSDKVIIYKSEIRKLQGSGIISQSLFDNFENAIENYQQVVIRIEKLGLEKDQEENERKARARNRLTKILKNIFTRVLLYVQFTQRYSGKNQLVNLKNTIDPSDIRDFSNRKLKKLINSFNYVNVFSYLYKNFAIVRDLYNYLGMANHAICILTFQKFIYPANFLMKSFNHFYNAIPKMKIKNTTVFVDEYSKSQEATQDFINKKAIYSKNLIQACRPIVRLKSTKIEDGVLGENKKETQHNLDKAIEELINIFQETHLDCVIRPHSSIKDRSFRQLFAASPEYSISQSNSIGAQAYWIDTYKAQPEHDQQVVELIDLRYYNFDDPSRPLKNARKNLKEASKKLDKARFFNLANVLTKLHHGLEHAIKYLSKTANKSDNKKIEYGDFNKLLNVIFHNGDGEERNKKTYRLIHQTNLNNGSYKSYDENTFSNGIAIYSCMIDSDDMIQIQWLRIPMLSDRLMLDIATKMKVIGLDATGDIKADFYNYSSTFLKAHLADHFEIIRNPQIFNTLKDVYDYQSRALNIQAQVMPSNESNSLRSILEEMFDDNVIDSCATSLAQLLALKLPSQVKDYASFNWNILVGEIDNTITDSYLAPRRLKLLMAIISFIQHNHRDRDYRSMLCFLNRKFCDDELRAIRNVIKYYCQKNEIEFDENSIVTWDAKSFRKNSKGKAEYEKDLADLAAGKCKIVLSTYKTMGTGQNVDYDIPQGLNSLKNINLGDRADNGKKDWDAFYLASPTQIPPVLDLGNSSRNSYEGMVKVINRITKLDRLYLGKGCTRKEYLREIRKTLNPQSEQKDESAKFAVNSRFPVKMVKTRIVAQALGRGNRTNNRLNQIVYLDGDLSKTTDFEAYENKLISGRAYPLLTPLESVVKKATLNFSESSRDIINEKVLTCLQRMDEAENMANTVKRLVASNSENLEAWTAHDRFRIFLLQHFMMTADEHKEFVKQLDYFSNGSKNNTIDAFYASWLRYAFIKEPDNYEVDCYYTKSVNGNYIDIGWNPDDKSAKNLIKFDFGRTSRICQLIESIPGFKQYLEKQTVDTLLPEKEIELWNSENDLKRFEILNREKEIHLNLDSKGSYLLTPAYYWDLIGFLGELAAKYLAETSISKLLNIPMRFEDYTEKFESLKSCKEVADATDNFSTLENLHLYDFKIWDGHVEAQDYYQKRVKKIAKIIKADGVKKIKYIMLNIFKTNAEEHSRIYCSYPWAEFPNIQVIEVPFLVSKNEPLFGKGSYRRELIDFWKEIANDK